MSDEDRDFGQTHFGMAPYGKITMEIYDEVFNAKDFEAEAEDTICHEMLHVALYPLISYCENMFDGDEGKKKELEKLEETIVTAMVAGLTKEKK